MVYGVETYHLFEGFKSSVMLQIVQIDLPEMWQTDGVELLAAGERSGYLKRLTTKHDAGLQQEHYVKVSRTSVCFNYLGSGERLNRKEKRETPRQGETGWRRCPFLLIRDVLLDRKMKKAFVPHTRKRIRHSDGESEKGEGVGGEWKSERESKANKENRTKEINKEYV